MAASNFYAIIAGVGSGTGRSLAMKFAAVYPTVYLLARKPDSYNSIVEEINSTGGKCKAIGISTDVTSSDSVKSAISQIKDENKSSNLAAAIYNVGGAFVKKPFLELTEEEFRAGFDSNGTGLFNFSQATLPLLLNSVSASPLYPPTLLLTGASASLRGGAQFASFAAGKTAMRAVGQSLAKEFGPQGVHVAHAIIDGVIDTPMYRSGKYGFKANGGAEDGTIQPDEIADAYWYLHTQHRSCWTQEIDLRPYVEKF